MSSSSSPCAACKFLRRKCTQGCVFSPYFPPDQPHKFANVHGVFGAKNVAKLLNELSPAQREDAVNSLAYEAEARLRDPVYGCVGYISILQHKQKMIQNDLFAAKKELASFIGPAALGPFLSPYHSPYTAAPFHQKQPQHAIHGASSTSSSSSVQPSFAVPETGIGLGLSASTPQMLFREQQQQQQIAAAAEVQQLAVVTAREQEILRSLEQQQQQQEIAKFDSGYVDGRGFNRAGSASSVIVASPPSGLALVSPQYMEQQLQLHQYMEQHHQAQRARSDEGRSGLDPTP